MSWIAFADAQGTTWTAPDRDDWTDADGGATLDRGSLVIETRLSPEDRPQMLLDYSRSHLSPARLSLQAMPGGGVVLVMSSGGEVFHSVLPPEEDSRTDVLRLTFSWDATAGVGRGRLAVERPEADTFRVLDTPPPPALLMGDIYTIVARPELCPRDPDVVFIAVSSAIEPVGPQPDLSGTTPVETTFGPRRIADLRPGDLVHTHEGHTAPVLARLTRRVPALGSFAPVRLRAPHLGLDADVAVAPHARMVIGGSDVDYIFGREAVLIPAAHLAHGISGTAQATGPFMRYHQLLLPRHAAPLIAGAAFESLYAGRLRRDSERLAATLLSTVKPVLLPEHHRAGYQVLKPFEAITLVEARAA